MTDLATVAWPLGRLADAVEELARRAGLRGVGGEPFPSGESLDTSPGEVAHWMESAGARLGISVEEVDVTAAEFESMALAAGPALFHIREDGRSGVIAVLGSRGHKLRVVSPSLVEVRVTVDRLRDACRSDAEKRLGPEIDRLLEAADVTPTRRARAHAAMLRERAGQDRVSGIWILRPAAHAPLLAQLRHARLPRRLGLVLAAFASVYTLELAGWALIGHAALEGRLDYGWLVAWILLTLSLVPLRSFGGWCNATFALDLGRILKQKLLAGALRADLGAVRRLGAGQLLGRVMESQALESLALDGGLAVMVAALELAFAAWILALGAGGGLHVALLIAWLALMLWWSLRFAARVRAWTRTRLGMTHDLIERMVGHRTQLAQARPGRRDEEDDRSICGYLASSEAMDRSLLPVTAGIRGGWTLVGLVGLVPAFVSGTGTPAGLAIGIGGILLANRAFSGLANGISSLSRALLAWEQVQTLFATDAEDATATPFPANRRSRDRAQAENAPVVLDAAGLTFRHDGAIAPVLAGADLTIRRGDRILVEGPSGGGKSTLASLLVGLRKPDAGLILLEGLDRHTLGNGWHRLATEAPQFHENHILSGPLAFNLLMGRNWPATEAELGEAEALCVDLGLGDLLARMPAGLMQMVGETGWQLSHGERSRIFLARALLQKARLTILDESFAALDPETLGKCLQCSFDRAETLMVIAHP